MAEVQHVEVEPVSHGDEGELKTVTYFCPGSCEDLATEQPRDTGEEYFGPAGEEDGQLVEATSQQHVGVAKTDAKPEPGTVYFISETCVSGSHTDNSTRSSAIAERLRVALCHRIFR